MRASAAREPAPGRGRRGRRRRSEHASKLERLAVQVFGALDADQHRVAFLLRIALLLGRDQALPDLVVDRPGLVHFRRAVEARDAALGQQARFAQRGLAHEDGDLGAVVELRVGRAFAALPECEMLVVVHHGAAARADLRIAVGERHADEADIGRKGGIDVLVQRFRNHESSLRTISAPLASAASLPNATSRARYFMPQSGATASFSAGTNSSAARMRSATCAGVSTVSLLRSMTPTITLFGASSFSTARSRRGCAASIEICDALLSASWPRNE